MIVAVDEADDLFAGVDEDNAATRQGSKVFMHRIVERVRAPTIWIVNDVDRLGPAVVRRMNLVVRFPQPTEAVRRKIVERIARREKVRLEASAVARLASLPAAPALIENAIRSAARIRGAGDEALAILGGSLRAMGPGRGRAGRPRRSASTSRSARRTSTSPTLTARIRNAPSKALSFCLSGPPGTGKSAYARHLAAELGLEAIEKRYSDLVSKYVGDSEKAIAAAFQEAADARAFLILDEADSLLRDRALAHHSWEVTQVNEMLTWMERHPLPFACTTNAVDLLDPATARRFLFKVRFLPMDAGQVAAAFRKSFKAGPACIAPSARDADPRRLRRRRAQGRSARRDRPAPARAVAGGRGGGEARGQGGQDGVLTPSRSAEDRRWTRAADDARCDVSSQRPFCRRAANIWSPRLTVPYLTKSRYMAGLQCPRRLWLTVHEPQPYEPPEPGSPLDFGQRIGIEAHRLFPGGTLIDEPPWEHAAATARTAGLMAEGAPAIFEAAFEHEGVRVRVDALERLPGGAWGLREVKSSASVKDPHLDDVALQAWVVRGAGVALPSVEVIHVNSAYVRGPEGVDWPAYFTRADVLDEVEARIADIPARLSAMREVLAREDFPAAEPGRQCSAPYECAYWDRCAGDKPADWILRLPRLSEDGAVRLREMGIEAVSAIPADFPLTGKQAVMREAIVSGRPWVADDLRRQLEPFGPPAAYLDFEAMAPPIPLYEGTRPYQALPFQWSLHELDAAGRLGHREFLADGAGDPRRAFAESLVEALAASDTPIVVYSAYEKTQLNALAEIFPDLRPRARGGDRPARRSSAARATGRLSLRLRFQLLDQDGRAGAVPGFHLRRSRRRRRRDRRGVGFPHDRERRDRERGRKGGNAAGAARLLRPRHARARQGSRSAAPARRRSWTRRIALSRPSRKPAGTRTP